jgi:glycosyltransferase involved in cell wall biosynthesis
VWNFTTELDRYMSTLTSDNPDSLALDDTIIRSPTACPVVDVSLVVPVFNEGETIGLFLERVRQVFGNEPSVRLDILFVNDGSTDATLPLLLEYQRRDRRIRVVDLSRNFGKEAALSAGLQVAQGRVVVLIDVDLQDPPELVREMIACWREGFDVVLGRRLDRESDSWAKRMSADWFYRIHNLIAESKIPENVGDFRLMDRAVVDALNALPESRRFMKGLFAWVGFRTTHVDYKRPKRIAGSSKFNGWVLWNFALEGLTSFSTALLRIWTYLGGMVALTSFVYGFFIALKVLIYGIDLPGYASIFVAVTFLGGLQLVGIGVIGEYLGRTYLESKGRPIYLIRRIYEQRDGSARCGLSQPTDAARPV